MGLCPHTTQTPEAGRQTGRGPDRVAPRPPRTLLPRARRCRPGPGLQLPGPCACSGPGTPRARAAVMTAGPGHRRVHLSSTQAVSSRPRRGRWPQVGQPLPPVGGVPTREPHWLPCRGSVPVPLTHAGSQHPTLHPRTQPSASPQSEIPCLPYYFCLGVFSFAFILFISLHLPTSLIGTSEVKKKENGLC